MQYLNFKNLKYFGFFLMLIALFSANLALAKVQLEVEFPEFAKEALSSESTLPETIRYVFNLAIIIAILVVFFSLVSGGIIYLSSTGNPAKTALGKKRITRSGLGLFILTASYLLLTIVNPQFLILKITKVPIQTGILFLNDKAFEVLDSPSGVDQVNMKAIMMGADIDEKRELINEWLNNSIGEPRAVYLGWSTSDLKRKFGDLNLDFDNLKIGNSVIYQMTEDDRELYYSKDYSSGDPYSFENFKLKGFFFLPNANKKISTYYYADFRNRAYSRGLSGVPDNEYAYPDCSALTSKPCAFEMLDGKSAFCEANSRHCASPFPISRRSVPMSIKIEDLGKGVILHSTEFDTIGRNLSVLDYSEAIADLGAQGFDDKTKGITIKNWDVEHNLATNQLEGAQTKNYLAILYDETLFRKNFRIFFEQFNIGIENSQDMFTAGNLPANSDPPSSGDPDLAKLEIKNEPDAYGRVNKASSIQVFEIPQTPDEIREWEQNGGCKVFLCAARAEGTLRKHFHHCLIYDFDKFGAGFTDSANSKESPWYLFAPFNIPDTEVPMEEMDDDGNIVPVKDSSGNVLKLNFNDRIRSLRIEGDCLVALFQNAVNIEECKKCTNGNTAACNDCWNDDRPGEHSEVFSLRDVEYPNYKKLTTQNPMDILHWSDPLYHPIGTCGCFESAIGRVWKTITGAECRSCASSIAVFPFVNKR